MSASARFHTLLKRLFKPRTRAKRESVQVDASEPRPSQTPDSVPMFSLGENKQELVASYRNLDSKSA